MNCVVFFGFFGSNQPAPVLDELGLLTSVQDERSVSVCTVEDNKQNLTTTHSDRWRFSNLSFM